MPKASISQENRDYIWTLCNSIDYISIESINQLMMTIESWFMAWNASEKWTIIQVNASNTINKNGGID